MIKFNRNGNWICKVSKDGRYLYIYDICSCQMIYWLYRGYNTINIFDLNFSIDNSYLTLVS
jgi:hypothetical protein